MEISTTEWTELTEDMYLKLRGYYWAYEHPNNPIVVQALGHNGFVFQSEDDGIIPFSSFTHIMQIATPEYP